MSLDKSVAGGFIQGLKVGKVADSEVLVSLVLFADKLLFFVSQRGLSCVPSGLLLSARLFLWGW